MSDITNIPSASLELLISMLSSQAMVSMGILNIPGQEKVEKNLPVAQHLISLLEVLETKTQGNVTDGEKQLLERVLHELRMSFLAVKDLEK